MRSFFASFVEFVHLLGVALLVGASASLTLLTAPTLQSTSIGISIEQAGHLLLDLLTAMSQAGMWLAAIVFVSAIVAPILRQDNRRALSLMRAACAAGALAMVFFALRDADIGGSGAFVGDVEGGTASEAFTTRSDRRLTPWTALLVFSALDLWFAAFQIRAGAQSGTAKKKPKPE